MEEIVGKYKIGKMETIKKKI